MHSVLHDWSDETARKILKVHKFTLREISAKAFLYRHGVPSNLSMMSLMISLINDREM